MRRGLTKEMGAKKRTDLRLGTLIVIVIVAFCAVYFGLEYFMRIRFYGSVDEGDATGKGIISLLAIIAAAIVAVIVWRSYRTVYALFWGMYIGIDDSHVVGFIPVDYRFSYLHEEQNWCARKRITRLYLVMAVEELGTLLQEQWSSVWFKGHAVLPVELEIPGVGFPTLYICRSTLKRVVKVSQRENMHFVELVFEFTENDRIGRTTYERERTLLSMWDVTKLRAMYQSDSDIRFNVRYSDGSYQRYLITWEQLEQYERTLTEAYQIIDPQPLMRLDDAE